VENFDAIVVGAGPAGSAAAYRLASAGASVLLLDRERFPRDKPCGGGLTGRAVDQLPFSVDPVVEDVVSRFELRFGYGRKSFERVSTHPLVRMTQRRRLDAFLVERAADAGAEFRDGVRVEELSKDGIVRGEGLRATATVVIGADGVNGVIARSIGLTGAHEHGVALEGNAADAEVDKKRFRGRAVVELGSVPGGYGWVFPKGDHVNFGVGGWESEGPRLRDHLRRLCAAHGIDVACLSSVRGFRLPMRRAGAGAALGRAALVGDAAGLVDPLSGDGIFEAFLSARLAAAASLDVLEGRAADFAPYERALNQALAGLESASWGAKVAFDRYPTLTFAIARLPIVWRVVEGLLRGELRHPSAARGLVRGPLRVLESLARAAGDPGAPFRLEARAAE
jgi:geranylgeranyl reductase family protein